MNSVATTTGNLSIPALVTTIKALVVKYEHATEKAEQYAVTLGLRLKELKDKKPDGISWAAYVEKKVGMGRSSADNFIAIADGRTTMEETRARSRIGMQRVRENNPPSRYGGNNSQSLTGWRNDRSEEEKVIDDLDRSDEGNAVLAYMFQLTGAQIAYRNCTQLLPMIAEMKRPPTEDDWDELLLSTRQRAEQFTDLLKQLEAMPRPESRRKKSILAA